MKIFIIYLRIDKYFVNFGEKMITLNKDINQLLKSIVTKKQASILKLKKQTFPRRTKALINFKKKLSSKKGLSLIAELKKRSPSKGLITKNFDPIQTASHYLHKKASALSILTEEDFFEGNSQFIIDVKNQFENAAILMKDFFIDPIQVEFAHSCGADAILLLVNLFQKNDELSYFIELAKHYNLSVLLESHTLEEVKRVINLYNTINMSHVMYGINNRDLVSFLVDMNTVPTLFKTLKSELGENQVFVAESGYNCYQQLQKLQDNIKSTAVLIGEGLVTNPNLITFFNKQCPYS